ncbi:MAG: primosomal protein N', partial [Pedobacter sp.]
VVEPRQDELLKEIELAVQNKEQVILFQNRRGYATIMICSTCGYTSKCINCDVSLTYHKASGKLHCHYCGFVQSVLNICPACGSVHILQKGFGTERIEEELKLIFPDIRTSRMDLDSTRTRNSMQLILSNFQEKKTDVLIGTQMVAKGLDFDNVTLIGVINADTILNYPDFRAFERGYQLLAQVSGRAGRREKKGTVLIQTYDPNNRIIGQVKANDYQAMYEDEIKERAAFNYPPFTRLIFLNVKHKDQQVLKHAAKVLSDRLRSALAHRVLGPEQPLIARVRSYYIEQVIIKIEKEMPVKKVKELIKNTILYFNAEKEHKNIRVQIDVDPY